MKNSPPPDITFFIFVTSCYLIGITNSKFLITEDPMKRLNSLKKSLTLIELVVVMLILVALAGILVPRFPGVLTQAHVAATTTNVPSIESAVQSRSLLKSGDIGSRFDSLIDSNGVVPDYMPGNTFWEPLTLTNEDIAALGTIGVAEVITANASGALTDEDATFGSHDGAPAAPATLCAMTAAGATTMLQSFNVAPDANSRYIALGIGQQCTLVGGGDDAAFSEAPVHFGDTAQTRSNVAYTRYFLIVEIANRGTGNEEARLLGAAAPHENGLERNAAHLKEFYGQ